MIITRYYNEEKDFILYGAGMSKFSDDLIAHKSQEFYAKVKDKLIRDMEELHAKKHRWFYPERKITTFMELAYQYKNNSKAYDQYERNILYKYCYKDFLNK